MRLANSISFFHSTCARAGVGSAVRSSAVDETGSLDHRQNYMEDDPRIDILHSLLRKGPGEPYIMLHYTLVIADDFHPLVEHFPYQAWLDLFHVQNHCLVTKCRSQTNRQGPCFRRTARLLSLDAPSTEALQEKVARGREALETERLALSQLQQSNRSKEAESGGDGSWRSYIHVAAWYLGKY